VTSLLRSSALESLLAGYGSSPRQLNLGGSCDSGSTRPVAQ
jgi:hypothetical protein